MSHEREIGGHVWKVETFTGRESLALFRTLTALAADPIAEVVRESTKSLSDEDEINFVQVLGLAGGVVGLAGKIASQLTDQEFTSLADRLFKQTLVDGGSAVKNYDAVCKGDVLTLLEALAFVVEVNFVGPFFRSWGPAVSTAIRDLTARIAGAIPETSSETKSSP